MQKIDLSDTIAAISTPIGEGGIGIVRLSGTDALSIADRIFVSRDGSKPSEYKTYTTHYGYIVDQKLTTNDQRLTTDVVDEVLVTVMRAPKSYTKEDVIEINCHGGIVPLKKILELVLSHGARLAEPGEFTKRAFLNGRIDLTQAEAVLDIIKAKTHKGLEFALTQLDGGFSRQINNIRRALLDMKVNLEASIDFPEEHLSVLSQKEISDRLKNLKSKVQGFINSSDSGKIVREGITCVISGKPNVGKSSLMNALLKEERVIVTPIPGTTRDCVTEYINLDGIPLQIVDTAGIIETKDIVEKEGVIRSKLHLDKSDLILFVMDAKTGISDEDKKIIELIKDKELICVINKIDLVDKLTMSVKELTGLFGKEIPIVEISVLKKKNMDKLFKAITDAIWKGKVIANDFTILANARHKDSLLKVSAFIEESVSSFDQKRSEEIIAISIDEAIGSLGEITGETVSQEVLNRIFERFCVGK